MTYCYLIQVPTLFHELSIPFPITSVDFRLSILELLINILSVSRPKATSGVGGKATSRSTDHSSYLLGRLQGSIYLLLLTETLGTLLAEGNGSLRGSCVLRRSHQAQHYSSSNHLSPVFGSLLVCRRATILHPFSPLASFLRMYVLMLYPRKLLLPCMGSRRSINKRCSDG